MKAWQPQDYDNWQQFYSKPELKANEDLEVEFRKEWNANQLFKGISKKIKIIFLRGYYSSWMPGNLKAPRRFFDKIGFRTEIAPLISGGHVRNNGNILTSYLEKQKDDFLLLCHSKGGLDFLAACSFAGKSFSPYLRGIIFSQTPSGHSIVMNELLGAQPLFPSRIHKLKNQLMLKAIKITGHLPGGICLTEKGFMENRSLFSPPLDVPLLSVATWSIKASSWVDSYHARLTKAHPGCAHDGQFYLCDQLWSKYGKQLILGGIDHAQPAMGGLGFNHCRYWLSLINMLKKYL